jgi:TonB family protein
VQRLVAADYPLLAQQARIEGIVELGCTIGDAGQVLECRVSSGHPLLAATAVENAKKWTFRRKAITEKDGDRVSLRYEFVLVQGPPVRSRPKVEFSFEMPNHVRLSSEIPCADHIPCTPEEWKQYERQKGKAKRSIP